MTTETEIKIDTARAVELLRELVAETGDDFRYKRLPERGGQCVYVHNGQPSCGVGRALTSAGVSVEALEALDSMFLGGTTISSSLAESLLADRGVSLTLGAQKVFGIFQKEQDEGESYGTAMLEVETHAKGADL